MFQGITNINHCTSTPASPSRYFYYISTRLEVINNIKAPISDPFLTFP
jgi:hypothetical protein